MGLPHQKSDFIKAWSPLSLSHLVCQTISKDLARSILTHSTIGYLSGLFLFAFTLYRQVHWIVPIILIIPFGAGVFGAFVSVFTFIIATYRSLAASAIASNTFLRSVFAAAFPLISKSLYERCEYLFHIWARDVS